MAPAVMEVLNLMLRPGGGGKEGGEGMSPVLTMGATAWLLARYLQVMLWLFTKVPPSTTTEAFFVGEAPATLISGVSSLREERADERGGDVTMGSESINSGHQVGGALPSEAVGNLLLAIRYHAGIAALLAAARVPAVPVPAARANWVAPAILRDCSIAVQQQQTMGTADRYVYSAGAGRIEHLQSSVQRSSCQRVSHHRSRSDRFRTAGRRGRAGHA